MKRRPVSATVGLTKMPQVPENSNPILYKKNLLGAQGGDPRRHLCQGRLVPAGAHSERSLRHHPSHRAQRPRHAGPGRLYRALQRQGHPRDLLEERIGIRSSRASFPLRASDPGLTWMRRGRSLLDSIEAQLRRISLPLCVSLHRGDPVMERSLHALATEAKALTILQPAESPQSGLLVPRSDSRTPYW